MATIDDGSERKDRVSRVSANADVKRRKTIGAINQAGVLYYLDHRRKTENIAPNMAALSVSDKRAATATKRSGRQLIRACGEASFDPFPLRFPFNAWPTLDLMHAATVRTLAFSTSHAC